jgi:putative membrane protein
MMGGGMMGGGFGSGFGLAGGLIGLLLNIAILVGIVLLVVWAVRQFSQSNNLGAQATSPHNTVTGPSLSAREVLDIRYARGELTRDDYQTILSDIG